MGNLASSSPRVFISYAHGSTEHEELVLQFYELLRANGVDARLDVPAAQRPQDWSLWMLEQLAAADFVLVVASNNYKLRAEGAVLADIGRGVQYESALIRDAFYRDQRSGRQRFIPVLLPGHGPHEIPAFLTPWSSTHFRVSELTTAGAESLLRLLLRQPSYQEPEIGPVPNLSMGTAGECSASAAPSVAQAARRLRVPPLAPEKVRAIGFVDRGGVQIAQPPYLPVASEETDAPLLHFITEEVLLYRNYLCGTSVNFSLDNASDAELVVYSLVPVVDHVHGANSALFQILRSGLPPVSGGGISTSMPTWALRVELSADPNEVQAWVGRADESAGSGPLISPSNLRLSSPERYNGFERALKRLLGRGTRAPAAFSTSNNAIPPSTRYLMKPGEVDSFHCQVSAEEPGIYLFHFEVSFHVRGVRRSRLSDQVYTCIAGIGF